MCSWVHQRVLFSINLRQNQLLSETPAYEISQVRFEAQTRTIYLQFIDVEGLQKLPLDLFKDVEEKYSWHVKIEDRRSIPISKSSLEKEDSERLKVRLQKVAEQLLPSGVSLKRADYQEEQFLLQVICTPDITEEQKLIMKAEFQEKVGDGYILGVSP